MGLIPPTTPPAGNRVSAGFFIGSRTVFQRLCFIGIVIWMFYKGETFAPLSDADDVRIVVSDIFKWCELLQRSEDIVQPH